MQKLEGLKQARVGGKRAAEEEQEVEAAAAAIADPEVQRPVIQLQKKRRVGGSSCISVPASQRPACTCSVPARSDWFVLAGCIGAAGGVWCT